MRRTSPLVRRGGEIDIDSAMTPMIDVVFLLLVFFVWTSSFDLPEFDLPSSLAQPPNGGMESEVTDSQVESFDEIIIKLDQRDGLLPRPPVGLRPLGGIRPAGMVLCRGAALFPPLRGLGGRRRYGARYGRAVEGL